MTYTKNPVGYPVASHEYEGFFTDTFKFTSTQLALMTRRQINYILSRKLKMNLNMKKTDAIKYIEYMDWIKPKRKSWLG